MRADDSDEEKEKKNPVRKQDKEREFKAQGKNKEVVVGAPEIYAQLQALGNSLRGVTQRHPRLPNLELIDFGLRARGPVEDEVYTMYPFYRNNVRRGNTLIVDRTNKPPTVTWARKGLTKFFDVTMRSLKAIQQDDLKQLSKKHELELHYAIFQELENALSFNDDVERPEHRCSVHLYRLNKANGENAQISYHAPTNDWIIASKNVAIAVSCPDDLKVYGEHGNPDAIRYSFAVLIAETWFRLITQHTPAEITKLKAALAELTLVGEYIGNQEYQHLVKYEQVSILFYAAVRKDSA